MLVPSKFVFQYFHLKQKKASMIQWIIEILLLASLIGAIVVAVQGGIPLHDIIFKRDLGSTYSLMVLFWALHLTLAFVVRFRVIRHLPDV